MAFAADCWGEAEFRLQAQAHAELRLEVVLLAVVGCTCLPYCEYWY